MTFRLWRCFVYPRRPPPWFGKRPLFPDFFFGILPLSCLLSRGIKIKNSQIQIGLIQKPSRSFSGPLGGWPGRILSILPFFQPLAEHDEDEAQSVKEFFLKSLQEYGEKVVSLNDRKSINAMKAMTRTLKKSMKCNPNTIHQQLHTFGKGGAASRKSKWGRVINPNPPAIASTRLAPGSRPTPLGHF